MRRKVATSAGILVLVGFVILGTTMMRTDNDTRPNWSSGTRGADTPPDESSKIGAAGPALQNVKMWVRQVYPQLGFVTVEGFENLAVIEGSILEVVEGGVVVAQFQVTNVEGKEAAADILPESVVDGKKVRAGDAVVPSHTVAVPPEERGRGADRIAKGTIADGGIDRTWGFVIVERNQGSPEKGDEAYLQRLGPEGGLMSIESVEPDNLVLKAGAPVLRELKPGDRVETRPTTIAEPSK